MLPRALFQRIQREPIARQFSPGCVDSDNLVITARSQIWFERVLYFAISLEKLVVDNMFTVSRCVFCLAQAT